MQGKLTQAEKIIIKMLEKYPTDLLFLTESGIINWEKGEKDKSTAIFNGIQELDPENVTARDYLDKCL